MILVRFDRATHTTPTDSVRPDHRHESTEMNPTEMITELLHSLLPDRQVAFDYANDPSGWVHEALRDVDVREVDMAAAVEGAAGRAGMEAEAADAVYQSN